METEKQSKGLEYYLGQETECLFCGESFTSKRGRRLCPSCKKQRTDYLRHKRDAEAERIQANLADMLPAGRAVPSAKTIKRQLTKAGTLTTNDQQPIGWLSPKGSDEGYSTQIKDVAGYLQSQSRRVAQHPWFKENPHWSVGIPGSEDMLNREGIESLSCGRKRGTTAGYKRHKRDKTMVCPECSLAWKEYYDGKKYSGNG